MQALAQQAPSPRPWLAGAYVQAEVEAWSNGLPILDLDGDWGHGYERRSGSQRAYVTGRFEAGAAFRWPLLETAEPWRMGVLMRADGSARASGEAAQVLYHYQSRSNPDQPVTYNVDTDTVYWRGKGVALHAPSQSWGAFKLDMGWDHMTLQRMRSLQTQGTVSYNADDSYTYQGTLRDDNATAHQHFLAPPAARGQGDALSLSLSWARADEVARSSMGAWMPDKFKLKIDDVWSRLSWAGVNGDDAVLNSNVATRTPDGYIEYQAAINGLYTRRGLVERIPMSTQVQMAWTRNSGEWTLRVKSRLGLMQQWLGWQQKGAVAWRVEAEPVAGALRLGVDWGSLSASVMSGRLDNGTHARGAQLAWGAPI
ncbi:hypothetical protein [Aquabacterium sp.]|uniref:hypothetical protein n=1 Tax=Aquabacterium sp. TaxID=1872578 RepID=UPI002E33B5BE|nr:hypothetical protein [Aquabacterium sp.]